MKEGRVREAFLTPLCSAPWDREHKQREVDGTGKREAGMLTAEFSLSHTHTLTHILTGMHLIT